MPNSEVKRCIADDSVGPPHAKVGHRQGLIVVVSASVWANESGWSPAAPLVWRAAAAFALSAACSLGARTLVANAVVETCRLWALLASPLLSVDVVLGRWGERLPLLQGVPGTVLAPSDARVRERLDSVDAGCLRRRCSRSRERGKGLDGSTTSTGTTCPRSTAPAASLSRCIAHRRSPRQHHEVLRKVAGGVQVHPDHSDLVPLRPESILLPEGSQKCDCERSAAKRLLCDLRRAHPHPKLITVEDGVALQRAPHPPPASA
jgi:hypothetical protein